MTALSILRLLPDNGRVATGRVDLAGTDLTQLPEARMRDVRGRRVSIIFQEPATSLNPVLRVATRSSKSSSGTPRCAANWRAPRRSTGCAGLACPSRSDASTVIRFNFPADRSNA